MAFSTERKHGMVARVEKGGVKMEFTDGWDITVNLDMSDASRQGQGWKEGLPGQAGWSGSFSGQYVPGNPEQKAIYDNIVCATPGTKLTDMKFLQGVDTQAFTGDLFITSANITGRLGDAMKFTVNFQGEGPLSNTDAA